MRFSASATKAGMPTLGPGGNPKERRELESPRPGCITEIEWLALTAGDHVPTFPGPPCFDDPEERVDDFVDFQDGKMGLFEKGADALDDVGLRKRRTQCIHRDVLGRMLSGQRSHQTDHSMLVGNVDGVEVYGRDSRHACGGDHLAAPPP